MYSIIGNNKELSCFFGATTACLSIFFILFISGCGKSRTVDKKIDSNEQEISRLIDVQNNVKRALLLDVAGGKTPGEVDSLLGAHISEQSLLDFFPGRSTKYYSQEELVHNRGYNVQEKKVVVFFGEGKACGWAQ